MSKSMKASSSNTTEITCLFILFAANNIVAGLFNHIDDTDETYGYWEPLHYLLFGTGMQTWEYSPHYAIRSYAFIYPVYLIGSILKFLISNKLVLFYALRCIIGLFTAYSEVSFITSIKMHYNDQNFTNLVVIFLLFCSGIFFFSTSFLPSAVSSSLLVLCYSHWLRNTNTVAIFWGSLAVLWSGWPFVAVLLVPIGAHMLISTLFKGLDKEKHISGNIGALLRLVVSGLAVVVVTFVPSLLIDAHFYGKWTCPTINIALYNAIGGSGDELYGIEPASYYVKNLFLNTGLAWPLALLWPLFAPLAYLAASKSNNLIDSYSLALAMAAGLWIGILFSRPHKEERFMYPVYPLLAFLAAQVLRYFQFLYEIIFPAWLTKLLSKLIFFSAFFGALSLSASRSAANYRNYGGYLSLWQDIFSRLTGNVPATVCVGSEWYQFPSHFFLPQNARLEYIDDGFRGVLPQHFPPKNSQTGQLGTSMEPLQPFNDRNEEETSRYIHIGSCDYYVSSTFPLQLSKTNVPGKNKKSSKVKGKVRLSPVASRKIVTSSNDKLGLGKAYLLPPLYKDGSLNYNQYSINRIDNS